jgi:hypothetical protein
MISEGQKNIKIHFAGAEKLIRSNLILEASPVKYILFTIYPFLCNEFGIKHGYQQNKGLSYSELANNNFSKSKHCIQDSGLFSLMFGSHSGDKSENFIEKWFYKLIELTLQADFKGTVVEVDSQNIIGLEKTWK